MALMYASDHAPFVVCPTLFATLAASAWMSPRSCAAFACGSLTSLIIRCGFIRGMRRPVRIRRKYWMMAGTSTTEQALLLSSSSTARVRAHGEPAAHHTEYVSDDHARTDPRGRRRCPPRHSVPHRSAPRDHGP